MNLTPAIGAERGISIEALITQFDANPFGTSRALRQLRDLDPKSFSDSALTAIADLPECSGIRFVATLVPLDEAVLYRIADPKTFNLISAERIVAVMRRLDTQTDARLLRLISANPSKPLAPQITDRILDLVDAVSDGPRLVPMLMQIFRSANSYLRARLSLSIGKHHRNRDWLEDRMRDPDPRVRANTVEANWNHKDESALTLFAMALRDPHHRVVANGAVGLYYAGDLRSLRYFGEMIQHRSASFRAAGLWALGHVQETRFRDQGSLPDEEDAGVRRSFVVAQARLKRAIEVRRELPLLKLWMIKVTRQPLAGEGPAVSFRSHLFLIVKDSTGAAGVLGLKAIQFQIYEDGKPVLDYSTQERTSYHRPGAYDLYFETSMPEGECLKVLVATECAFGEYDSTEAVVEGPKLVVDESTGQTWDAFESRV